MSSQLFTLRFYAVVFQSLWVWACDIFDYNSGKCSEAQFGFQSVMQSGDVKSCTHCFSVGFYFSSVAGASKVCHSRRLDFEPRPPLAVFVLHLAELTRAPIVAVPLAMHLAEFSWAQKSPVESGKLQQSKF